MESPSASSGCGSGSVSYWLYSTLLVDNGTGMLIVVGNEEALKLGRFLEMGLGGLK